MNIVITGAGGVLCSAFAKALAADGHKVALLDLNLEAAEKVAAEIRENGGEAIAVQADVLDKESLQAAHDAVEKAFGRCEVLVNGAPLGLGGYLDIGLHDTMKDLFVNLIGAAVFSAVGFFYVKNRGRGRFARRFIPTVPQAEAAPDAAADGTQERA